MVEKRKSPDELLQRIQEEEREEKRGKLKIYLGAAPGVGKTYTMLHDALEKRQHALDVVVGVVESHGRKDIEQLLEGLEVIPRQMVQYRDKIWTEFDLAAVLQRQPGLVLIDEMAHTNAPGLNHAKRWQDINEVLDRGIDVYTTLNVQHIESLKDDVMQIIHAPIKETVPDFIIERATTIELVDLPPDELLKRLQEGKVYIPEQAELAKEHFFRLGNLIALRELALRTTAERVGADVLMYRQGEKIKYIWPTSDKILVCVGSKPDSLKLIRAAKRMATSLHCTWMAVFVDTPKIQSSQSRRNAAIQNLRLAELLGAETHVLSGFDIVQEVMNFAHEQNVTQIMIRKQIGRRWFAWFRRSLADEMVRHSGEIDVYIMTSDAIQTPPEQSSLPSATPWKVYGSAVGVVILATLFNMLMGLYLAPGNMILVYVLGVIVIALQGLRGPAVFASILSILAYDYYFIPPFRSFIYGHLDYLFSLIAMLLVTQVISYLTIMIRNQEALSQRHQYETRALYTLSRQLNATRGVNALLTLGTRYIGNVFNCDILALLPKKGRLEIRLNDEKKIKLDEKEMGIAQWVYEMVQAAGLGTDTLSFSNALYMPLSASRGCVGVLRIQPKSQQLLTPEQMGLLESCVHQLALTLEVDRLQDMARKKELEGKAERERGELLQMISDSLSQPLDIVITAMDHLKHIDGEPIRKIELEMLKDIDMLHRLNEEILKNMKLHTQKSTSKKS